MTRMERIFDHERGSLYECVNISKKVVRKTLTDKSNYHAWSLDMIAALKCVKLWPINDSDDDATEKTLVMLRTSVSESICRSLSYYTKAVPAWEMLKTTFGKNDFVAVLEVKKKICNIKLKENEDLITYINRFKDLKNELALLNKNLKDDEAIIMLLQGLPKKYSNVIRYSPQTFYSNFDKTVSELLKIGRDYDVIVKTTKTEEHNVSKGSRKQNKNMRCFNCDKYGHHFKECPYNKINRFVKSKNVNVIVKDDRNYAKESCQLQ